MPLDQYQQTAADYLGWLWNRADLDYESNPGFYEEARDGLAIILRRTAEETAQQSVQADSLTPRAVEDDPDPQSRALTSGSPIHASR